MRFRIPKVRITSYRPQPERREDETHDRMVQLHTPETLRSMEADLSARNLRNQRDPETRWCVARLAAIRKRLNP